MVLKRELTGEIVCTICDTAGAVDIGPIAKGKIDFKSVLVSDRGYYKKESRSLILS